MAASFGTKIFRKLGELLSGVILRLKNFVKITLSSTIFKIEAFLCFAFLKKKFENPKWSPFLESEIFVETWKG